MASWYGSTWGSPSGKTKGKGKKGSSYKGGSSKGDEWEQPTWDAAEPADRSGRIQTRFQYGKLALRASADADGSCLVDIGKYGVQKVKKSDREIVKLEAVAAALTVENSHLVRRPGTGLSEARPTWHKHNSIRSIKK